MPFIQLPVLIALLCLSTLLPAQATHSSKSTDTAAKIDAYVRAHHTEKEFSGSVLVAEEGEVVYRGAFGLANADWKIANQIDTKFRLASITKQFTAMLVLLLVDEGKLALDAPITRYLPDYPAESGDKVTIHHLLRHSSGIPSYTRRPGFMQEDTLHSLPVAEFVAKYCSDPLEFEPGTEFHYSNSGYYLLGAIVEAVTGRTYRAELRARIFDPLAMHESGVDDQDAVLPHRATGYDSLLGSQRLARWIDMSNPYAAGALYSTVGDLWKWDQALRARRLLSPALYEKMYTPGKGDYGYGWGIDQSDPAAPVIEHSGGIPGFSTIIWRVPARGRCIIVLCNSSAGAAPQAARGIHAILDGESPPHPALRADRALAQKILDDGIDAGLEQLATLPTSVRERRIEPDLNFLGYQLVEHGRIDDAIRLLEFNTRAYPQVANTWDSLGEAHFVAGNWQLARTNYRKALELDPQSATAPPMLEKIEERLTPKKPATSPSPVKL